MLDIFELRALTTWCAASAMRWRPLLRGGNIAILLEPVNTQQCWERIVLTWADDDYELVTEAGDLLAVASDLHSVLDALRGGVAEPALASIAVRAPGAEQAAFVL